MRTVVAIVEAQPETIAQDYQRLLKLAKVPQALRRPSKDNPLNIFADSPSDRFEPGFGATPWQVHGVLSHLEEGVTAANVISVSAEGVQAVGNHFLRRQLLDGFSVSDVKPEFLRPHRHVSQNLHPALDEVLTAGVQLPVGLAGANGMLLSAPTLSPEWGLSGTSALLQKMALGKMKISRRTSLPELAAESLMVLSEAIPRLSAVLDGTLWGVTKHDGKSLCLARNVLLAGNDPLAVDVVAMRLAGLDPQQVPWVRMCQERGIGQSHRQDITVAGQSELLDLDFKLGGNTFGASQSSVMSSLASPLRAGLKKIRVPLKSGSSEGQFSDTVWAAIAAEYADDNSPRRAVISAG